MIQYIGFNSGIFVNVPTKSNLFNFFLFAAIKNINFVIPAVQLFVRAVLNNQPFLQFFSNADLPRMEQSDNI